jgi:hypothetical protein
VRGFYELAAEDEFERAWAFAGPGFRRQLGGFDSFRGTVASLESISFDELRTVERRGNRAEVALRTTATHTNRRDRCSGTLRVSRSRGSWLVDGGNVSCASS